MDKWFFLTIVALVGFGLAAGLVSEHKEGKCLEAYATSNRSSEEINLICRGVKSSVSISDRSAK